MYICTQSYLRCYCQQIKKISTTLNQSCRDSLSKAARVLKRYPCLTPSWLMCWYVAPTSPPTALIWICSVAGVVPVIFPRPLCVSGGPVVRSLAQRLHPVSHIAAHMVLPFSRLCSIGSLINKMTGKWNDKDKVDSISHWLLLSLSFFRIEWY